jgi:hypothetical protein
VRDSRAFADEGKKARELSFLFKMADFFKSVLILSFGFAKFSA